MKKIPTLFVRDFEHSHGKYVTSEVNPGCEWVTAGDGRATRKFDGTCVLVRDGVMYKRREFKDGAKAPDQFEEADYDETTGKHVGWVPVDPLDKGDRWYGEAVAPAGPLNCGVLDGTYELCGPKVQGNPEGFTRHVLVRHGGEEIIDLPRDYEGLRVWLAESNFEGIVFWRELGNPEAGLAKIKKRDFPHVSQRFSGGA